MLRCSGFIGVLVLVAFGSTSNAWAAKGSAKQVIRLNALKVEGKIQKPQAFYIMQRSNLNFEGLELTQSFIPLIIRSVEQKPF